MKKPLKTLDLASAAAIRPYPPVKKPILLLALTLAAASTSFGTDGTFGFGIELTGTGAQATNNGVSTLYALDQTDNNDLTPTGSTAMLSTAWSTNSTAAAATFNLGTFTTGNTLVLKGGVLLTYQGANSDGSSNTVNSAAVNYEVAVGQGSGTFPSDALAVNATNFGNPGNIRWSLETGTTNLLAGLAPGTYELDVFGSATTTNVSAAGVSTPGGATGDTNNGANWGAVFTVVPEPGTMSLLLMGLGGLIWSQRRFGKAAWKQVKPRLG